MSFVVDCQNAVKTDILMILIASATLSEDLLNTISRILFSIFPSFFSEMEYKSNHMIITQQQKVLCDFQLLMATLKKVQCLILASVENLMGQVWKSAA